MMKHIYFLSLLFLATACQMSEAPEPELTAENNDPVFLEASSAEKQMLADWLSNGDPNARTTRDYDPAKLVKITNNTHERLAVVNSRDPNTSFSFVLDPVTRKIGREMISTSIINRDKSVTSKIFNTNNKVMMKFVYSPDGSIDLVYRDKMATLGFWSEWDKCLDTIGAPFPTNFSNNVFDFVANTSTLGMWTPAVHLVCLGVAGGLNYQNNQRK